MIRRSVPYVLASDCCPVCFERGRHVKGCPRTATAEDIEKILDDRLGKMPKPEGQP